MGRDGANLSRATGGPRGPGLLLAPGAGGDRNQPALVAIEAVATAAAFRVVRMDFPYRKAGRRFPDRAAVLVEAVVQEAAAMAVSSLVLGGRSMGGRMCSLAGAQAGDALGAPLAGLVLISYPLHPPGRPDRLRVEHFPTLGVPCLFVSGSRDPFGTPSELEAATAAIPGPVSHHWISGKGHPLRGAETEVADVVGAWLAAIPAAR